MNNRVLLIVLFNALLLTTLVYVISFNEHKDYIRKTSYNIDLFKEKENLSNLPSLNDLAQSVLQLEHYRNTYNTYPITEKIIEDNILSRLLQKVLNNESADYSITSESDNFYSYWSNGSQFILVKKDLSHCAQVLSQSAISVVPSDTGGCEQYGIWSGSLNPLRVRNELNLSR